MVTEMLVRSKEMGGLMRCRRSHDGILGAKHMSKADFLWAFGENKADAGLVLAGTQKASALGDRQWDRPSTRGKVEGQCAVGCWGPLEAQ